MSSNVLGQRYFYLLLGVLCFHYAILPAQVTASFTYEVDGGSGSRCAPLNVAFTNASSSNVVNYEWSVDGTVFSDEEDPIRNFADAGTFEICLEVDDGGSQSDQHCESLQFFAPPTIELIAAQGQNCDRLHFDFTINSTTTIDSVGLDFGDGAFVVVQGAGMNSVTQGHDYSS